MAVSRDEKDYIVNGKLAKGRRADELWILPNERERFVEFAKHWGVELDKNGHAREISVEEWREYVRQTHAFRSAARVKRYFEEKGDVADAVARICAGHWLSFEQLRDYKTYPTDFSVLRETVNLRALAVYVRLIDMLDLAEDRTPYVVWKFVAPRESKSKMEWAKHRALRPVTCPPYQNGRIIMVDGSTNDHEVYAALEDLRDWCEEQFKGCSDLLAQMNDPKHKLDIYHIEWRVAAQEFEPISVRFEFDREEMFEILSEEIYQGDPYVFLRELLQNSIDAIRMRREVLKRKGVDPGNLGVIKLDVEHGKGGNAVVKWQDDGIGMDEYVIRNYLAMAGKSYYQSEDFKRQGLEMDPISRFGVGILSCFMVADRVEIETFKEPYFGPKTDAIKITIPAVKGQFRIERKSSENAIPGTVVKVFVEGKRLLPDQGKGDMETLDVTKYLSIVAGFVEFPIVISEGDNKTIIVHPKQGAESARQRFGNGFEVKQLDLAYPWTEAILPQDVSKGRAWLREKRFDVGFDLGLDGYDGILVYPVPVAKDTDFESRGSHQSVLRSGGETGYHESILRWLSDWADYGNRNAVGISRSSSHPPRYAVYRDGILLSTLDSENYPDFGHAYNPNILPPPRLVVNLPKATTPRVDLARTQVVRQAEKWFNPIVKAHVRCVYEASADKLLTSEPAERIYGLARLMLYDNIQYEDLREIFPAERWPLVFVESSGRIYGSELADVESEIVYLCPEPFREELIELLSYRFLRWGAYDGSLVAWAGERFLAGFDVQQPNWERRDSVMYSMMSMCETLLYESHYVGGVRFLSPPWEGNPPLSQNILLPMKPLETTADILEGLMERALEDPLSLSSVERELLRRGQKNRYGSYKTLPIAVRFEPIFGECFAYGWHVLNLNHPVTQGLLRIEAMVGLARSRKTLSNECLGHLNDALRTLPTDEYFFRYGDTLDYEDVCQKLRRLYELCAEIKLFDVRKIEYVIPSPDEFIPGTVVIDENSKKLVERLRKALKETADGRTFGMPLA